ncbi:Cmx/CmrA family chloramphenicol efflux MFS transporter [Streptomyces sp. NBC_00046]|uniref:Cmx/CmrA family chloramphenicol efflux MFS transporter n=1 Tax=unclassified Streptomyces TaxID=2593676 RepID=UPI0032500637
MPLAVYVLGMSAFALGTSEFMLAGLLPAIASDLGVSVPDAGLLVSAFAVGMLVGAPLLAVLTLRMPRRATMAGLLLVFVLGHVLGAVTDDYATLFASRVVSALACAGFWAVGAATAVSLVPSDRRGRAMAVMVGGMTVANVLGVPSGAYVAQQFGWRAVLWCVAVCALLALAGLLALVPQGSGSGGSGPRLRAELRAYTDGRVWLALATTALTSAGIFAAFSYLAPLLTDTAGLPVSWVPGLLALFGVGSVAGITLGGRFADGYPFGTLYAGIGAVALVLATLALALPTGAAVPLAVAVFLFGVAGFAVSPALNARVFALADAAPTLAGATNVSAFNLGNTIGPWLGGLTIDAGLGYPSVCWLGAGLSVAALGTVGVSATLSHRRAAGTTSGPGPHDRMAGL